MTEQNRMTTPASKMGLLSLLGSFPMGVLLLIGLFVWEALAPIEYSIFAKIGERIGTFEKEVVETSAPANAFNEQLMQLAVSEIDRVNQAYQSLFQANSQIMVIAYQMDDKVLQAQIELIKDSYGATKFNTNIADIGCAAGLMLGDKSLSNGCDYAEKQRIKMAEEIKSITENHRSSIPKNIISDLPKPEDLKLNKLEFLKLAEAMKKNG